MTQTTSNFQTLQYSGIFLLSAATLMLQVAFTRVLSVALWYHFVFMVVSIALFGYGASGTFLSSFPQLLKQDLDQLLTLTAALFSVASFGSYIISNQIPFDPARLAWDRMQIGYIMIYYLLLAIPFFLSGLCVALAVSKAGKVINKLYFSNLIGSGLGSFLVLFLFSPLTGPGVMVFTSLLAGVSAFFFSMQLQKSHRCINALWLLILLLVLPFAQVLFPIHISPYKSLKIAQRYPNAELLDTQWNAFSRVDVIQSGYVRYAPGISLQYQQPLPDQIGVTVDGDTMTAITRYDGNLSTLLFTAYLPSVLPYYLHDTPYTLVLGAGGGLSVLSALYHNASSIVAVEVNPLIVDLMQHKYKEFAGNIYGIGRVKVVVSEGRSFIRASTDTFDIIELSMTDNAAASSTGIHALSENYLHTKEAFIDYFTHLSPRGMFTVTRWLLPPPREDIRLVSLAVDALESLEIKDPENYIAVIRTWGTLTLLIKKNRLDTTDNAAIREFCRKRSFDIVYLPGISPQEVNRYNQFPEPIYYMMVQEILFAEDRDQFYERYLFDITPVSDERPFFFHFFKWNRLYETYKFMGRRWQPLIEGGFLVPLVFVQALALSMVFILLPLRKVQRHDVVGHKRFITYFFCLGLGYMFIEITLIQRFILFLGHPTYAVSTVLFSLLLSSGGGSYFSGRVKLVDRRGLRFLLLGISTLSLLYIFLSPVFLTFLGLSLATKLLVSFLLIVPLGFVLGMPFPLGIRLLSDSRHVLIPWAWAANGCASVLGSILPVIIALSLGFSTVFVLASLTYLIAYLFLSYKHPFESFSI
ncbi:MAG: hypothetical protein ACE5R6_08320 [Candidatus Heimdallarchaeota archaeon]